MRPDLVLPVRARLGILDVLVHNLQVGIESVDDLVGLDGFGIRLLELLQRFFWSAGILSMNSCARHVDVLNHILAFNDLDAAEHVDHLARRCVGSAVDGRVRAGSRFARVVAVCAHRKVNFEVAPPSVERLTVPLPWGSPVGLVTWP